MLICLNCLRFLTSTLHLQKLPWLELGLPTCRHHQQLSRARPHQQLNRACHHQQLSKAYRAGAVSLALHFVPTVLSFLRSQTLRMASLPGPVPWSGGQELSPVPGVKYHRNMTYFSYRTGYNQGHCVSFPRSSRGPSLASP